MTALLLIAVEHLNDFLSTYPVKIPQTSPDSPPTVTEQPKLLVLGSKIGIFHGGPVGDDHQTAEGLDLATSSAVRSAASAASEHLEEMAQVYRIAASGGVAEME